MARGKKEKRKYAKVGVIQLFVILQREIGHHYALLRLDK